MSKAILKKPKPKVKPKIVFRSTEIHSYTVGGHKYITRIIRSPGR